MPGIIFLKRRWNVASDDLFYPGLFELICRFLWFTPQLVYYVEYNLNFQCADVELLHLYYVGFLCIMIAILFVQFWIVIISSRGTITYTYPRRHMAKFLYARALLVIIEFIWSIIGLSWLAKTKWNTCSNVVFLSVLANILFCACAIFFVLIVLFIVFDPISHLQETDVVQKRDIINYYLKKLCICCYCCLYSGNSRKPTYENSYKHISSILELIFRNGDLTPSDIAAGIILLSNKELDQFNRESKLVRKYSKHLSRIQIDKIPKWMNLNEAAYYVKYAVATYTWPYYLYMNTCKGFCDLFCACGCGKLFCCNSSVSVTSDFEAITRNMIIHGDTKSQRHLRAFKLISKIEECDLIYANFHNELFLVPFCILVDHFKKTVVITIRGTLSMRDVVTDMTAECGYFDVENLGRQPCHVGILKTAENILNRIKSQNLLEEAFRTNPNYQLMVTGHSLGAGTAVILAIKLRTDYPNLRCIAYSPPGGLISEKLAEFTKSFVMSIVVGDDIVPRLSLHSVHNLKADILKEIYNTNLPKFKILWKYSVSFVKLSEKPVEIPPLVSSDDEDDKSSNNSHSLNINESLDNSYNSATSRNLFIENGENITSTAAARMSKEVDLIKLDEDNKIYSINTTTATATNTLSSAAALAISNENKKAQQEAKRIIKSRNGLNGNLVEPSDFDPEEPSSSSINDHKNNNKNGIRSIETSIIAHDLINKMMRHVKETYPDLHLPGNILYIYQIKSNHRKNVCSSLCSKIFCCCDKSANSINYDSRWATREEFKKILITNRMLMDHFPNTVDGALNYFNLTIRII